MSVKLPLSKRRAIIQAETAFHKAYFRLKNNGQNLVTTRKSKTGYKLKTQDNVVPKITLEKSRFHKKTLYIIKNIIFY
jgi:hypothetical protein